MNAGSFVIDFINPFVISSIINGLLGLLFGIFIYLNNRKNRLYQIWLLFSLCYAIWSFSVGMMAGSHDKDHSFFWGRVLFTGAIFIPITYVHSLLVFLNKEQQYKRFLWTFYSLSLFFFFSNFTKYLVLEVRPILSFAYWTKAGILMYPFALMFSGLVIFGMIQLIKAYQGASGTYRSQIQYFLLAMTIGYSSGVMNFLPTFDIAIYPYGNYIVLCHLIIMSYAIAKYRLMGIDIVYRKGAVYLAGLILMVIPATFAMLLAERHYFGSINTSFSILILSIIAVVAILFYGLKSKAEKALENTLFYKKYNPYKVLTSFSKEIVSVLTLDELLDKTINTFVETLNIKKASIFLFDEEKKAYIIKASHGLDEEKKKIKIKEQDALLNYFLEKEDVAIREEIERYPSTQQTQEIIKILKDIESEIAIPFMEKDKVVGFCNLSAKGDRGMYNHEDIELFLLLGRQAAVAIQNAQLVERIKESKQVIRRIERLKTVGDLAAGFAHEIRNPLVPIKACLQLLPSRYGKDPDFTQKIPVYALQEVERIEKLLMEIMNYSRPRTPVFKEEDINEITENTVQFIEYQAKKKRISIERGYDKSLPMINVDGEQIKQVLLNLIMNAMDAVNGSGRIEIATRKAKHMLSPSGKIGEGGYVQIEVRDNGTGIANEELDRIFNPFYTTKHESSSGREGTGLGLSIVQEIVDEHCGFVDVRSEVGVGSSFYVNLPVETAGYKEKAGRREDDPKIK